MKTTFLSTLLAFLTVLSVTAANQNIANLITSSDWNALFPNRAQAGHPQGATDDFYSYARFTSAVDEISNYSVTFSSGPNDQGTSVAVTKSGTGTWTYIITGSSWGGDDYTVDYSTFCNTGNNYNDKRELAAFLANITKETTGGWVDPDPSKDENNQPTGSHGSWGLYFLRELGPGSTTTERAQNKPTNCYTVGSQNDYQPVAGKCYYGRGPIQMSYFYNYGNFSEFLYNNTSLVSNPDLVEQDGELAFLSAIWFWMTPQCPKPSCHQVMQEIYDESATSYSSAKMSKKGFLHTVNIINGSVECRSGVSNIKPVLRSKLYRYYMSVIGFTASEIANEDMGEYETLCNESSGAMQGYISCDFQNVVINNCSSPALGNNKELVDGSADLDASVALKDGETIAWYKDNILISGAIGTTYTATEAGVYKVVVTGTDCTKEDYIEIFNEGEGPSCSKPALGDDVELSGGSAVLNANITLKDGETIKWYFNNAEIWNVSTTTYTATAVGTYKAVVTGTDCSEEDEIVVSAEVIICSKPDLGGNKSFSGDPIILDAGITLKSGETIQWSKDNVVIWSSTGTTHTATAAGTYKVVVSGPGWPAACTEEDEVEVIESTCSAPALGNDKELVGGSAVLDASVTLEDGETIAWYKDEVLINGETGTTYTATQAGIYKAVVTGTDCTNEDQIEVFNEGEGPSCSKPALGDDIELSGGSAALDANITLQDGETVTWYKNNSQIWGVSTTTYTTTTVGTYKVVVTGTDCSEEDEIVVSEEIIVCSKPDLGGDKSFSGDPVILDVGIILKSGESIEWYKDGARIWNISSSTYSVTELGTYKVVVISGPSWSPNCTEEDEIQVVEATCSTPDLGDDVSLCQGTSINLNANIAPQSGESLKWYKDDIEIVGATGITYIASAIGTYKAEISTEDCIQSDEIIVNDGGVQPLEVEASNNGEFCSSSTPNEVTLTVTGGEGDYKFYDVPTDGDPLGTGSSFVVNSDFVEDGTTKTFYVQENGGTPVTVGVNEPFTSGAWVNFSTNQNWNNYRIIFNTLDDVTIESVDLVFYQNHVSHTIVVTVYDFDSEDVVATKILELDSEDISYVSGSVYPLNKIQLDLELPAGNYELSFIGSTFTFHLVQSGIDYTGEKFSSAGIVEFKGVNQPGSWNYPAANPSHVGAYNWVFKSGGAGSCGRASQDVTAYCGINTNSKEVVSNEISVYPNPASDIVNVNLGNINSQNSIIELYSSVGQLVMSKNIRSVSGNITEFKTSDLDGGLYFLKILADGNIYSASLVITK